MSASTPASGVVARARLLLLVLLQELDQGRGEVVVGGVGVVVARPLLLEVLALRGQEGLFLLQLFLGHLLQLLVQFAKQKGTVLAKEERYGIFVKEETIIERYIR